jgi:hypothetical protein
MERLTLNVLLSFAQFEREVIGERIRDKIVASKKKGMWMDGCRRSGIGCRTASSSSSTARQKSCALSSATMPNSALFGCCAALREARSRYINFPAAKASPVVLRGDEVSGTTFWHGTLLNRRAADWLAYWTGGRGRFVMTEMEETGTLQALSFLARDGRVDMGAYWYCALAATTRYHRLG